MPREANTKARARKRHWPLRSPIPMITQKPAPPTFKIAMPKRTTPLLMSARNRYRTRLMATRPPTSTYRIATAFTDGGMRVGLPILVLRTGARLLHSSWLEWASACIGACGPLTTPNATPRRRGCQGRSLVPRLRAPGSSDESVPARILLKRIIPAEAARSAVERRNLAPSNMGRAFAHRLAIVARFLGSSCPEAASARNDTGAGPAPTTWARKEAC